MPRHWSNVYSCQCGKTFRSYAAEARHRHNFPLLCKAPKNVRPEAREERNTQGVRADAPAPDAVDVEVDNEGDR